MAWSPASYSGTHQYRKEASAHGRANTERAALNDAEEVKHHRKSLPCHKRKFGIEYRYIGPDRGSLSFLFTKSGEWHKYYNGWYAKEKDRDQAIAMLRKNHCWRTGYYEYRTCER